VALWGADVLDESTDAESLVPLAGVVLVQLVVAESASNAYPDHTMRVSRAAAIGAYFGG
jgi:hypothetical protein